MRVTEVTVTLHAEAKRSPRQYETDAKGAHVSMTAALAENDSQTETVSFLWAQIAAKLDAEGYEGFKGSVEVVPKAQDNGVGGRSSSPSSSGASKDIPSGPAPADPTFKPATEPSEVTPEQRHEAAKRKRYAHVAGKVEKALAEHYLPKPKYVSLLDLCKRKFGPKVSIKRWVDLTPEELVLWADAEGVE